MSQKTEGIANDIRDIIDKIEALRAGQSVETGFLIERGVDQLHPIIRKLHDFNNYDLDEIDKALKGQ